MAAAAACRRALCRARLRPWLPPVPAPLARRLCALRARLAADGRLAAANAAAESAVQSAAESAAAGAEAAAVFAGPNRYANWLLPRRVCVGGFPCSELWRREGGEAAAREALRGLVAAGVRRFVCLDDSEELVDTNQPARPASLSSAQLCLCCSASLLRCCCAVSAHAVCLMWQVDGPRPARPGAGAGAGAGEGEGWMMGWSSGAAGVAPRYLRQLHEPGAPLAVAGGYACSAVVFPAEDGEPFGPRPRGAEVGSAPGLAARCLTDTHFPHVPSLGAAWLWAGSHTL